MTNDLTLYQPDVQFTPAVVKFDDEKLKKEIAIFTAKYQDYLVNIDNLAEAKRDRATLRKLKTALDNRRKEIKKEFNAPFKAFEDKFKDVLIGIDEPILAIDTQVKAHEERVKSERFEKVTELFKDKALSAGLDYRIFDSHISKYVAASFFTEKNNMKKVVGEEVDYLINNELSRQKQRNDDVSAIATMCADYNMGSAPFVRDLDNGMSLGDIIENITRDHQEHIALEAKKRADDEEKRQAQAKIQETQNSAEMARNAPLNAPQQFSAPEPAQTQAPARKKKLKVIIELVIDPTKPKFKQFLDDNGFEYSYKIVEVSE